MTHTPNFLSREDHGAEAGVPAHAPRKRRLWPYILLVGVLLLVAYFIVAAVGAGRVLAASLDAKDAIDRAETAAVALDFATAKIELDTASTQIARAKSGLFVLAPLRLLPYVSDQVRGVGDVLSASERLIPSLQEAIAIASEVVEVVDRAKELADISADETLTYLTLPESVRHDLLTRLHQSGPALRQMRTRLRLAEEDLEDLESLTLAAPLAEAIQPFKKALPELARSVDFLIPLSEVLPEFAGLDGERRFLVLLENNTELRPGGGFIGTYGTLTVKDGAITGLTTDDSYAVDGPVTGLVKTVPPDPLRNYTGVDAWYFRDVNWSPDFSTVGPMAISFLSQEIELAGGTPSGYSGVIAFTPTVAADLLEIVGPVTVNGQTFTSDNVVDELEYQVELGFSEQGIPRPQRKEVVGALVAEVMNRLFSLPLSSWSSVIDTSLQALAQKQILLFSHDAPTQEALVAAHWAGVPQAPSSSEDGLMVVDANLASLKTDPVVSRSIEYHLRQNEQGRLVANAKITYTHTGDFDWKTTRYRTYTRVYVPPGSTLIRGSGMLENDRLKEPSGKPGTVDVFDDAAWTVFGAFIAIEPGAERTLEFSYYLPDTLAEAVRAGTYQLLMDKQPGAQNHQLTVDIDFGTPLLSASPSEDPKNFGDTQYLLNTILDQDKEIVVRF